MNLSILKDRRDRIKQDEELWFAQHRDSATDTDANDYGWLWAQTKELRERLDAMISARDE